MTTVVVAGDQQDRAFDALLTFLRTCPTIRIVGEFASLRAVTAEAAEGTDNRPAADLVIVLQTYSDEFSQEDVNRLIGHMFGRRVLCCYGPWCLADDRTHAIWPVALRVPADSAEIIISMELEAMARGELPLSPMAAGEEVFEYRTRALSAARPLPGTKRQILVVSSDLTLRQSVVDICRSLGYSASSSGESATAVASALQTGLEIPQFVVLDIDSEPVVVSGMIDLVRKLDPEPTVIGMTVFPEAPPTFLQVNSLVDKTELTNQLSWLLAEARSADHAAPLSSTRS